METSRRRLDEGLLHLALKLYPKDFRLLFSDELLDLHQRRQARRQGAGQRAWGLLVAFFQIVLNAPLAWRDSWPSPSHSHPQGESSMTHFWQEAWLSVRVLFTRQRAFTTLCVLTLALGLGAVTAIFSVVHGVLLAPLPYGEPERMMRLYQQHPDRGFGVFSVLNFNDLKERARSFESLAAYDDYTPRGVDLTGGDRVERLRVLHVSSGYFESLGVQPVLGRTFTSLEELAVNAQDVQGAADGDDVQPIMPKVAVLSHAFWQRRFSGDTSAVGKTLELNQETYEVVGVMPSGMGGHLGGTQDLWLPANMAPGGRNSRGNLYMSAVGRLAPGVTLQAAQLELEAISQQLRDEHANANEDLALTASPLEDVVLGPSRTMLWFLFAAVGAMLAIACINVANLFLARGLGQTRELRIRAALGAGGRRLFAATLIEGLWIGLAGGALGLAAAWGTVQWLQTHRPAALPRFDALRLDPTVFAFSLGAVLLTVGVFGLLPARRAARVDVLPSSGSRGSTGEVSRRDRRVRDLGVSLQVALSLILLSAGALLGRSFLHLQGTAMGFQTDHALTFQLRLPSYAYDDPQQRVAFYDELFARLDAQPDIVASGATSRLPGNGHRNHWAFLVAGQERLEGAPFPTAEMRCVSGRVVDALSIDLLAGRDFGPQDDPESEAVVLVNRTVADTYFGGDALGSQVYVGGSEPARTIVGILEDTRHDPREAAVPKIYFPQSQFAEDRNWDLSFVVTRSETSGASWTTLRRQVEAVVAELDPRLVVYDVRPLADIAAEPIARQRFGALLMAVFAGLSLLLAAVGLFGALAYSVAQRRAEMGLRMALGASRQDILGVVVGQGFKVVAAGTVGGLLGSFMVGSWIGSQLHGVHPFDPTALMVSVAVLLLAATVAMLEPARRASTLDPARILSES